MQHDERLNAVAEIRPGYTVRRPERGATLFPYRFLQIKDVSADGRISVDGVSVIELPGMSDRYLAWDGDVVLIGRGNRNHAAVYQGEFEELVVGAQFWVIRPKRSQVLPQYLAWFINQPRTQQYFASRTHGTYIGMIQKEAVMELPVAVPPLEIQKQIVAVHALTLREQSLMEGLKSRRAELVSELCSQAVEQHSTGSK